VPDPTLETISASEAAALFNVSPWVTRWMLWQRFANGMDIDAEPDARMSWGTKLEPLILEQASEDMRLEVRPNRQPNGAQQYFRTGWFGCHRDGDIICPDRGPGAIETKSVFNYQTWMADWGGGKVPPRHVEIQLQVQMYVGAGNASPFHWGVIAVWIAGEVYYFERQPIPELFDRLHAEAKSFFASVKSKDEPDPFGATVELPWLNQMFPTERGKTLDLSEHPEAPAYVEATVEYRNAKEQEAGGKRTAEPLRAKLLAFIKDADKVILPEGVRINITPVHNGKRIKVYVPDGRATLSPNAIPDDILTAG
jgi:predicted phage-related endonuclease